ncbi:hypothetical protein IC744_05765 [Microbacterium hominis]|uniref:hypothetical protein n=1 Tax=Microbacterium TaxID=33882 RepID=UPI00168BDD8D|nr:MULTISPECIES: hypothetical protein [Microbacterium]QOC25861.1 hypothetical protein IC745_00070 [Microbacterium hominis]QOC29841.1 hypothetical protein IC744_05765 [Microbacterium hominis]QYF97766.1 hypothetical protein KY498_00395 [Microbacterium sp. PAMC21962]
MSREPSPLPQTLPDAFAVRAARDAGVTVRRLRTGSGRSVPRRADAPLRGGSRRRRCVADGAREQPDAAEDPAYARIRDALRRGAGSSDPSGRVAASEAT